jgi:taurine dioxygenase
MASSSGQTIDYGAGVRVKPSGAALGADVLGLDLQAPLTPAQVDGMRRAWADHLVLRIRGLAIDDAQLMRFSANFGELDPVPRGAANPLEKDQEGFVTIISNVIVDGKAIGGLGAYESVWHTDMSYNAKPPHASFLYAIEVPPSGGDTGFANMQRAYETLPADLKRQVDTLSCKHDASRNSAGELRRGYQEVTDPRDGPGAIHPLAIRHPLSNRLGLYLGRRKNAYIPGLSLEESERLLDLVWAHAAQPQLAWYQQWRIGDLVMWDNFAAMHRRDAFDPATRRLMHRTQITGLRYERAVTPGLAGG